MRGDKQNKTDKKENKKLEKNNEMRKKKTRT